MKHNRQHFCTVFSEKNTKKYRQTYMTLYYLKHVEQTHSVNEKHFYPMLYDICRPISINNFLFDLCFNI